MLLWTRFRKNDNKRDKRDTHQQTPLSLEPPTTPTTRTSASPKSKATFSTMDPSSGGIHAEAGGLKHSNRKATLASSHSRVASPSAKQMNDGDGISRRQSTTANKTTILAMLAFSFMVFQSSVMLISPWRCSCSTMADAKTESAIIEELRSSPIVEHAEADVRTVVSGMDSTTAPPTEPPTKPPAELPMKAAPKEKKNRIVFHFGPPKTATTSLQADLVELRKKQILASDHYWDSGLLCLKKPFTDQGLRLCSIEQLFHKGALHEPYSKYRNQLAQQVPSELPAILVETQQVLDAAKEQNISLVYSSEFQGISTWYDKTRFQSPTYFSNLSHFLKDWDVSVVVTYRRAFDWMLSSWKQMAGMDAEEGKPSVCWPTKDGVVHANMWTSIREWMERSSKPHARGPIIMTLSGNPSGSYVFIDGIIQAWRESGYPIHIMNFHSKRHISEQLLCDTIPDTPKSCEYLEQREAPTKANSRSRIWFAISDVIFTAAQRGLISQATQANRTRMAMTDELAEHHKRVLNKTFADLPLDCPPENELQELLNMSLTLEEKWMPEWHASPDGEAAHRKAFHRTVYEKREFCDVNLDRLFEGVSTWDDLLGRLNRTMT